MYSQLNGGKKKKNMFEKKQQAEDSYINTISN